MSRFWAHTDYAEDQPLSHPILTTHVLHRSFQSGATGGIITGIIRSSFLARRITAAAYWPTFRTALQRSTGVGAAIGTGAMAIMLPARMWGRERIEWQDRSWRLLENRGQLAVDDWSLGGTVLGVVGMALRRQTGELLGWRRVMGGAGLGNIAGVFGYFGWRYWIHAGRL